MATSPSKGLMATRYATAITATRMEIVKMMTAADIIRSSIFLGVKFTAAYLGPAAGFSPLQEHPGEVQAPLCMDDE